MLENEEVLDLTPTPTPTPLVVVVESLPEIEQLTDLSGEVVLQTEIFEDIRDSLDNVNNNVVFVVYLSFVLVLFELLRFVKGLRNKEV